MAALLKHNECSACGKRHHFTLPQGDLCLGSRYDYICLETGRKAEFRLTVDPEQVPHPPQGAVQLTPRQDG